MPWDKVGTLRSADAARDIHGAAEHAGSEVETRSDGEVATPLPVGKGVRPDTFLGEAAVLAEGKIVHPVAGEFVRLIETGKPPVSRDIEGILSYDTATGNRDIIMAEHMAAIDHGGFRCGLRC